MKCGKDKLTRAVIVMNFLLRKIISKVKFSFYVKFGDHKQKKIAKGELFFLTYFLIDMSFGHALPMALPIE